MRFLENAAPLWLIPAAGFLLLILIGRIRRARYLKHMSGREETAGFPYSLLFMAFTFFFLILALMRPVSNPRLKEVEQTGRNLVFVFDVSRSMLAEDLAPNRLERAKFDILNSLDDLGGNRVALVAFAGVPVLKCPLTLDYVYFSQAVSDLNIYSVGRGGTNLGDAVRMVMDDLFDPDDRQTMDIILITDGEDQESFPVESAARAGREGIRIVTVGLGDQDQGAPVPGGDGELLTYDSEPVYSKADMATLQEMADASRDGWAVSVESGRLPMASILRQLALKGESQSTGTTNEFSYDEHYRWALVPALVFLILAMAAENTSLFRRKR
ncbi:MAG: VWA domain-containing protein [Spirochaetales bacterium]|nr:VWA domain-containing protein [Spirochaetales bacterium]